MKLTVLKTFHEDKLNRRVHSGETITVSDAVGGDLIRLGLAEEAKTEGQKSAGGRKTALKTEGQK